VTRRSGPGPLWALCRALEGRDLAALRTRLDDDSVLHLPGSSGLGGDYRGEEAIVGVLGRMAAFTDRTLRFEVRRATASGSEALHAEGHLSGTRGGHPFGASVSADVTLTDVVFRTITVDCADVSAWDAVWSRRQG
jgi:hypothetical protein